MDGRVMHDQWRKGYGGTLPLAPDKPMCIEDVGFIAHNGMCTYDAVDLRDEALMTEEVSDFKAAGGDAMVECSAIGLRCDIYGIKRIAQATGVHVVACTGFYAEESLPVRYLNLPIEQYAKIMLDEVKNGIDGSDIYPGMLKIAMNGFTQTEENALRAAGRVAAETGLPVTVHPCWKAGAGAVEAVEALIEEGADPARVVVAHVGSSFVELDLKTLITRPESWKLSLETVRKILAMGANISTEFLGQSVADEMGGSVGTNDWQRLAGIYALIREGYAGQIMLGTDTCCKMLTRRFGGQGYLRLWRFVIPIMRDTLAIPERVIRRIFVENPAKLLAY
jgi:phosphotriesterase-related protein